MSKSLKNIELFLKNALNKLIYGKKSPELINADNAFFHAIKPKKILVLRQDRIGDLLVSEPFFRYLRNVAPDSEIDVALSEHNISAKSAISEYVDLVLLYKKNLSDIIKLFKRIRSSNYDLIIDIFDKASSTSSIICKAGKAKYTIGFDKENRNVYRFVVKRLDAKNSHIIERTTSMLASFGLDIATLDLSLSYNNSALLPKRNKNLLGINLSGSNRSKFWGVKSYIDFINLVNVRYPQIQVIVFSTPDYSKELEEIISSTKSQSAPLCSNFDEYALSLSACEYLLSPDTAAIHLSSAFKIKCLALYNQNLDEKNDFLPWFPYKTEFRAFGAQNGDLSSIKPDEVFHAFTELIG